MVMEFKINKQSDLKDFLSRNVNMAMTKWGTTAFWLDKPINPFATLRKGVFSI